MMIFKKKPHRILATVLFYLNYIFATSAQTTNATIPLFKAYPQLKEKIGYVQLGTLPTPIQKLEKLGATQATPNLYLKKDNESGTIFGGNKVRKLEFLLGDAVASKAKGVLTLGYAGSNHTCATALYAKQLGLSCTCLHLPQISTSYLRRNLLLSHASGAELTLFRGPGEREKAMHTKNKEFKAQTDQYLYFIPSGGSNEFGVIGFVNAAFELKEQIAQGLMPEPDLIYVALGSCATAAGLMLGLKVAGLKSVVIPICIEQDDFTNQHKQKLADLYNLTSLLLHTEDEQFPFLEIDPATLTIRHDFVGKGYANISEQASNAITLLNQTESIKLDGTYAGKAFAAMLDDLASNDIKNKVILFWNSFCSGDFTDTVVGIDYKQLPVKYHRYFQCKLQDNDCGC